MFSPIFGQSRQRKGQRIIVITCQDWIDKALYTISLRLNGDIKCVFLILNIVT